MANLLSKALKFLATKHHQTFLVSKHANVEVNGQTIKTYIKQLIQAAEQAQYASRIKHV